MACGMKPAPRTRRVGRFILAFVDSSRKGRAAAAGSGRGRSAVPDPDRAARSAALGLGGAVGRPALVLVLVLGRLDVTFSWSFLASSR